MARSLITPDYLLRRIKEFIESFETEGVKFHCLDYNQSLIVFSQVERASTEDVVTAVRIRVDWAEFKEK